MPVDIHQTLATRRLRVLTPAAAAIGLATAWAVAALSGCDGGTSGGGSTASAATPATAANAPATLPTTRKGVRVPAFPPEGTYADAKKVLRIATTRPSVVAMINKHAARLQAQTPDPHAAERMIALYDAGISVPATTPAAGGTPATTQPAVKRYAGAMIIQDHPAETSPSRLFFLHERSFVQVSPNVVAEASKARGEPVVFDPPVQIWFWLDEVRADKDDEDDKQNAPTYGTMMSASRLSLGLRLADVGAATRPVALPCAYFDGVDPPVLLDRVTLQSVQLLTRPLTRPASPK